MCFYWKEWMKKDTRVEYGLFSHCYRAFYRLCCIVDLKISKKQQTLPVSLILDGIVIKNNLASIQKDESWLLNEIRQKGAKTVEEVLYAEWLEEEPLLVQKYEG